MVYVSAPIVKEGDEVRFLVELKGIVVDPGPLTKEQNLLGLLGPKGRPVPEEFKTIIRHETLGNLKVDSYFVRGKTRGMIFRELRDELNKMSEENLARKVTAFSKYWSEEEKDILLSYDEKDKTGPYLYVVTDKEKEDET